MAKSGTSVDVHPRGLIIHVGPRVNRRDLGAKLRSAIGDDHLHSSPGTFIVPRASAPLVRELLGRAASWTPAASIVVEEAETRSRAEERAKQEFDVARQHPLDSLKGYKLLHVLDRHQQEAVAAMTIPSLTGLALFDEQGLGKTITALCSFDRLRELNRIDTMVVVAPKSALTSWLTDARKMFAARYKLAILSGAKIRRLQKLRSKADIFLTNYEVAVSDCELMSETLLEGSRRTLLVVDESFFVKNALARRSRAISQIRAACDRVVLLCGTPAPNAPVDLLHQLSLVRNLNLDELVMSAGPGTDTAHAEQALGQTPFLRRLKSEVLSDLPGKRIERVALALQPQQSRLYGTYRDDLVRDLLAIDDAGFRKAAMGFLERRTRLMQVCSNPGSLDPSYEETPAKLLGLDILLRELVEDLDQKVVVWSRFRYSVDAIEDRFKHYGLVRIDGTVDSLFARKAAITAFQEDPDIRLFIGNPAAAGIGITLTAAHHAVYESFSDQAVHFMQSVDRLHRRGQTRLVISHVMLTEGTIEAAAFERIIEKEEAGRELLGDVVDETITRERMLQELGLRQS